MTTTANINHHQTFGNGKAGQPISTITRHLVSSNGKVALCGTTADTYASYRYYEVATKIEQAPICQECLGTYEA